MDSSGTLKAVGGYTVWNSNNDGAGSGLDADTVDGLQSTDFLRATASSALNNATALQAKETGGTARDVVKLDGSNVVQLGNSSNATVIQGTSIKYTTYNVPYCITGTSAPATTPPALGVEYLDTTNKKLYKAFGTSSSADWVIMN
jgi:hypothetical protein